MEISMGTQKTSTDRNLNQWLHYLENNSPSHKIKLGLERVAQAATRLNVQHPCAKVITVAGTNGKGSTVNALEHIYCRAGYKVGSYTSPHLIHFNERIKLNLKPITDDALCEVFSLIAKRFDSIELSYFEWVTLAALVYFKQQGVDLIILEVGLGGRLDATNIIDTDLAIITTIDYDHQEYLGDTLEQIAYEKAGILRANKPFIYADRNPPKSMLEVANTLNAPIYLLDKDYQFTQESETNWSFTNSKNEFNHLKKPPIQLKSASAALMASQLLSEFLPVSLTAINEAMNLIFVPGRLQIEKIHQKELTVLFDVSHNAQSVQLLAKKVNELVNKREARSSKVHAVFSALKDKDILELINPLREYVDHWYFAKLDNSRAASADYLLSIAKKAEILVEFCYTSPLVAFDEAMTQAEPGDLIIVFGSFFTVGQVMSSQYKTFEKKGIL